MSEQYLQLPAQDQKDILQTAATQLGQQAIVLEKDIWVCWALQILFTMPDAHPMAFKGGTSLSKVYRVIERFSEDVDITLDYRAFNDLFNPFSEGASKTAIRKFSDRLKNYVYQYSKDTVVPYLNEKIKELPNSDNYALKLSNDGEKIWLEYPSVLEDGDDYLPSSILIELGGRNVIDPNERHIITPDIAKLVPKLVFPSGEVIVLSPERTFWEKATLIHVECNRGNFKANAQRLSRHWYDLKMLYQHNYGKSAINNKKLFKDVVNHKKIFFNASYANYEACLENKINLIPNDNFFKELKIDYEKMLSAGMIYNQPPLFDTIINDITKIENTINTI